MNAAQIIYKSYPGADFTAIDPDVDCKDIKTLYEQAKKHEGGDSLFDFIVIEYVEGGETDTEGVIDNDLAVHALERARDDIQAVIDALSDAQEGLPSEPILAAATVAQPEPIVKPQIETEAGVSFVLHDHNTGDPVKSPGRVRIQGGALEILLTGYGDKCSATGYGAPILLERYEGKIKLHVWSDINVEDPTHSIDMTQAREAAREIKHCKRCGSVVNTDDFCTDVTCPFSDHLRTCEQGFLGHPDHEEVEAKPCNCAQYKPKESATHE